MSYLEELLPEFRKGAKIRRKRWVWGVEGICKDENYSFHAHDVDADDWEIVPNKPIDWQYIIDHKCLCWFWDDREEENKHIGILKEFKKYGKYKFSMVAPDNYVNDISFTNCRPARKDELTFYEERNND